MVQIRLTRFMVFGFWGVASLWFSIEEELLCIVPGTKLEVRTLLCALQVQIHTCQLTVHTLKTTGILVCLAPPKRFAEASGQSIISNYFNFCEGGLLCVRN